MDNGFDKVHQPCPLCDSSDAGFDKVHQPCPLCDSSDAVGVNKDGSAKCFSCGEFMKDYDNLFDGEIMKVVKEKPKTSTSYDNPVGQGTFADLTDRRISKATAQRYGVRCHSTFLSLLHST
jgi:hypothetical protein